MSVVGVEVVLQGGAGQLQGEALPTVGALGEGELVVLGLGVLVLPTHPRQGQGLGGGGAGGGGGGRGGGEEHTHTVRNEMCVCSADVSLSCGYPVKAVCLGEERA